MFATIPSPIPARMKGLNRAEICDVNFTEFVKAWNGRSDARPAAHEAILDGSALDAQGFREIIAVSKGVHPYADNWWFDGHILGYEHTFTHSVSDFLMALESGGEIHPTFEDGVQNQKVLDAADRAARSRRWVKVA